MSTPSDILPDVKQPMDGLVSLRFCCAYAITAWLRAGGKLTGGKHLLSSWFDPTRKIQNAFSGLISSAASNQANWTGQQHVATRSDRPANIGVFMNLIVCLLLARLSQVLGVIVRTVVS
jgi:hypothetical protein